MADESKSRSDGELLEDVDYILAKLDQRVLTTDGGKADPMVHHWNLTEGDSAMHREAAAHIRALVEKLAAVRSERGPRDASGVEKLEPTFLEQIAIEALNEVKAWRDCDGNDGFPHSTREKVDAVLMTYEQRRIHRPLSNERPESPR